MQFRPHLQAVRGRVQQFIQQPPTIVFVYLLAVFLELEESVQKAPTIRLLENAICNKHYHNELPPGQVDESMCKIEPIQVRLAHIRGLLSFFDSLPSENCYLSGVVVLAADTSMQIVILFGTVFGSNADRNGRRLAFGLAVFGTICAMVWIYFTCYLWDRVPIELVWISSLFRLIGGGPAIAIAMCLTMASDLSSETNRQDLVSKPSKCEIPSNTFYRVFSAVLITDLIGPPIAYGTLRHSLWLPYIVCALFLSLTYPVLFYMPETLQKTAQYQESTSPFEITGLKNYIKFLADWRIFIGVTTVFLAQFRNNTIEILLPYTSVRFGLALGKAATLLSVVSAVNIVVFLVLLPAVSTLLEKRAGWSITYINICVARVSSALLAFGAAILAAAPNVGIVVVALIVYAAGFGVRLSILAVITSFVNSSKETAQLYTLVATTDAVAHMIASPLLQRVWSSALSIGGRWLVLPFIVLMGVFILAFLTSCLLKDKSSAIEDEDSVEAEREPLMAGEDD
ncbi:hypothetical protein AJ78_08199 [Emergomyces pasteurianus Ep9510]|uniref:Major facilitator superfamily (MFS) profile domain-containing protein n=1 Tax=Emergomyces pasteurianus Ep9510 TaxID=1447872 RepID=A0A1J9Q3T7_9EURO|nr:hypothetical protein AJ78_08199 [Emergomyces pasteurianus Ep9510]